MCDPSTAEAFEILLNGVCAVNYRKINGEETTPGTMKGYILGLQCYFCNEWGHILDLIRGVVLGCKNRGLVCVLLVHKRF